MSEPKIYHIVGLPRNFQQPLIGVGDKMPWHCIEDYRTFKRYTSGNIVILGRKTYESIGYLLPYRYTIVVSNSGLTKKDLVKHKSQNCDGCVARSVEEAIDIAKRIINTPEVRSFERYRLIAEPVIWIAGGAQIYESSKHLVDGAYVSWISVPGHLEHLYADATDAKYYITNNPKELVEMLGPGRIIEGIDSANVSTLAKSDSLLYRVMFFGKEDDNYMVPMRFPHDVFLDAKQAGLIPTDVNTTNPREIAHIITKQFNLIKSKVFQIYGSQIDIETDEKLTELTKKKNNLLNELGATCYGV